MKTRDWLKYLQTELRQHGKKLFTVTELANAAGVPPHTVNVELNRLVKKDAIFRYAHGKYGLPDAAGPEDLLPFLDAGAYITGFYALYRHNLITQVPAVITCFTNRRHDRSRIRKTPLGKFIFSCVGKKIYHFPEDGLIASPEQAFFDWIYISLRQGVRPETQATLRNLNTFQPEVMTGLRLRYPKSVIEKAEQILS